MFSRTLGLDESVQAEEEQDEREYIPPQVELPGPHITTIPIIITEVRTLTQVASHQWSLYFKTTHRTMVLYILQMVLK